MDRASNPALRRLERLVGQWRFEAGEAAVRGTASFAWMEAGAFLVGHADADPPLPTTPREWVENSPFPVVTVIALDDFSGMFSYDYADGRGVRRIYRMTLSDGEWKFWGQAAAGFFQRFTGTFSQDGATIRGRFERSVDGSDWDVDFDITYTKVLESKGVTDAFQE